ncbi:MAG: hypothetical protein Q9227_002632 [Pyrenula ochraceoflavens]
MARLSLNDADKQVRNWFRQTAESLNCRVSVDQMGNVFAIRPGRNDRAPPVMMGSHLDTQPTGGRYDGILGVNAGLEVLKTLDDNHVETAGPVGCVNWTKYVVENALMIKLITNSEEGARFPVMAVASAVWSGSIPLDEGWSLQEITPNEQGRRRTMKEELERIGYLGDTLASFKAIPFAAHFELHIEQGPILEDERRKIGVVQGVQAFKWFEITVKGRDSHAGTTPFEARRDALLCAAKLIVQSNAAAKELGGLATTGILEATPGSINTMASEVKFTLDVRHPSDEKLAELEKRCRAEFHQLASKDCEKGCLVEWKQLIDSPAVVFHKDCVAAVEASAADALESLPMTASDGRLWKYMTSGAGHDSCYTNKRCPTSMIFTPTRQGISHNPQEYCSPENW